MSSNPVSVVPKTPVPTASDPTASPAGTATPKVLKRMKENMTTTNERRPLMHQIQITRTVKRTYQNGKYLVKIKPDRFMEILCVYLRQLCGQHRFRQFRPQLPRLPACIL